MELTKKNLLVVAGCVVAVVVGAVLFNVVQDLSADPVVVVEEAVAGDAPATEPAAGAAAEGEGEAAAVTGTVVAE